MILRSNAISSRPSRSLASRVGVLIGAGVLASTATGVARADAGELDRSFSDDGRQFVEVGDPAETRAFAHDLSVGPRGEILAVGGPFTDSYPGRGLVSKLTRNGALDPDFGSGGAIVFGPRPDRSLDYVRATEVTGQRDGKVIVAGTFGDCSAEECIESARVWRWDRDGSRDRGFGGGDGVLSVRGRSTPTEVIIGDEDSVVLCGTGYVQRRLADGRVDRGFGTGGTTAAPDGTMIACASRPDGGILAVTASATTVRLFKTTADGVPDSSFGAGGVREGTLPAEVGYLRAATIHADGSVLLAGSSTDDRMIVVRLLATAAPDAAFGGDGAVRLPLAGEPATAYYAGSDANGRVVAVGIEAENTVIFRLTATGELDTSFAMGGVYRDTDTNGFTVDGHVLPNGKVLGLVNVERLRPEGSVGFLRLQGD